MGGLLKKFGFHAIIGILAASVLSFGAASLARAQELLPRPEPLKTKETIRVAFGKFGFAAPLLYVPELLKKMNIEYVGIEFQRFADTRTSILTKEADVGLTGGTLLVQSLASGNSNLIALMGVAGETLYPVVRNGVTVEKWADLKGKKIAAAVGGNTWTQWVAKLVEEGIPYGDLEVVGVQGGGQNYNLSLRRGDIDVAIVWSPFNSMPIVDGYGYWPKALEYGMAQSVGGEQGIWMTHKDNMSSKKELLERFLWAYKTAEMKINQSEASKAEAIQQFTGIAPDVAKQAAVLTHFGEDVTVAKLKSMAKLMATQGIVRKDVSDEIDSSFDRTMVRAIGVQK